MLRVIVPDKKEDLIKGIRALESLIKKDTDKKSKDIHENALKLYKQKLESYISEEARGEKIE